jgi:rifampicin phosphotransferase
VRNIVWLGEDGSDDPELVGSKAARLAQLLRQKLPVPAGFVVTTNVYARATGGESPGDGALRPAIVQEISEAYTQLGAGGAVAVRSSATAEDLAGASFAGLYDTVLNVKGADDVVAAVRSCWRSMLTPRAVEYRRDMGIDAAPRMAVLVQTMVPARAAGVLFVGNPRSARADEIVVNASWGLGEGVVSGAVDPDELVLDRDTLRIKSRTLGAKDEGPPGYCLTDAEVRELGALGCRVARLSGDLPQDIEWALADGKLWLLQARPVTGVAFTWDEDLDRWQTTPEDDQAIWTRAFSDDVWNGGVTPLFYSVRGKEAQDAQRAAWSFWNVEGGPRIRWWKYFGGTIYYNTAVDETLVGQMYPPWLRPGAVGYVHPSRRQQVIDEPFSWAKVIRAYLKVQILQPRRNVFSWVNTTYRQFDQQLDAANGPGVEELRAMSDAALKRQVDRQIAVFMEALDLQLTGNYLYMLPVLTLLGTLLAKWYTEGDPFVLQDLITGLPRRSVIAEENDELWALAETIRSSDELRALFEQHAGTEFLEAVTVSQAGHAYRARYDAFLARYAHRGHQDRDIYFARRSDDAMIDDQAIRILVKVVTDVSPRDNEARLARRREEVTEQVAASLRRQPWGFVRVAAFRRLLASAHTLLTLREDTRANADRMTQAKKRCLTEVGRRLVERGVLEHTRDFYFLSKLELFDLLDGDERVELARAKVRARADVFDRFLAKELVPPLYLRGDEPMEEDAPADAIDAPDDGLRGIPVNRGVHKGRARVLRSLNEIGRIEEGDILVCSATDPGWSPVFFVIGGLVMETGGLLSHGSSLAREYGIPAVVLPGAMRLVEDGASITVDGNTGTVRTSEEIGAIP